MRNLALILILLVAAPALARPQREVLVFTNIVSNGVLNSAANTVELRTLAGGYSIGRVNITGSLVALNTHTWATDSRIRITAPGGQQFDLQPLTAGSTFTTLPVSASFYFLPGSNPAGQWTFRFYESFDDGGAASPDARWNLTFSITDDPAPAPSAADLGALASPGLTRLDEPLAPGAVRWYKFTLPSGVRAGLNTYLDLDTRSSVLPIAGPGQFPDDTIMGLYSATGDLLSVDDDGGIDFTSQLTFGLGGRPPVGSSMPFDGRDGPLNPGTYYLAVTAAPATFGPGQWAVQASGNQVGTTSLYLATNLGVACAPDCNRDGLLNLSDFGCFQTRFALGDPYADCNGDGVRNLSDFGCFQTKFALGCP